MAAPLVILISDNREHPGQVKLMESLTRHGWRYHCIVEPFRGLGWKISELYKYLKHSDIDEFIMLDAFDNYCIAWEGEWSMKTDRLIISAEKHCYPDPNKAHHFTSESEWRYPNSGQIYGNAKYFCQLVEAYPFPDSDNDQIWYTDMAIAGRVELDTECKAFQSVAFEHQDDFSIFEVLPGINGFTNLKTGSTPIFLHGNGKTDMTKFYEI